jgi:outer membrane immunogenic protein
VLKSLTAVSLLALGGAAVMGPAQAADIFDGNVDGRDGRGEFSRGEFLGPVHFNWSGIYVGGHFGGAWGDVDWTVLETPFFNNGVPKDDPASTAFPQAGRVSHEIDDWLAGGHIGFNQQFGRWVGGVEVSLSGGDLNESSDHEVILANGDDHVVGLRTEIESLFLATVRLGYAFDRVLAYVKGGYASADVKIRGEEELFNSQGLDRVGGFSERERQAGFAVGGGFEFALTNRVIFGLEYDRVDLGSETHTGFATVVNDVGQPSEFATHERFAVKVDPDIIHVAMARLSVKFGDEGAPLAAPMPPLK